MMAAAFIDEFGAPEWIRFDEFPTPVIGDRDVLVKVAAVTVNPIDTYMLVAPADGATFLPPSFAGRSPCLSLLPDRPRTVLAVKGSLRRAQQRRALDGSGPF
jgi:hypothetical protein